MTFEPPENHAMNVTNMHLYVCSQWAVCLLSGAATAAADSVSIQSCKIETTLIAVTSTPTPCSIAPIVYPTRCIKALVRLLALSIAVQASAHPS